MTPPLPVSGTRRLRLLALRLLLGGVFLYAGGVKLASPRAFADGIAAYQILPEACVNVFALALPPFEILLGAWLLIGWRVRSAAFCATCTLLVFLGAIVSARLRGLHVDCACFGADTAGSSFANGPLALVRDGVLAAAALVLYATSRFRL
jgi:putative oxidoreductase